ncbi:WG repeat-containing protein [Paenibacillus gallinarum]|uniref:WG repeat-containing protein n=1 Tax=Paenibacillus gallinarum TaxID=2762232 RepID=A0ABR8SXK4_9BACL|nr:WG repeat-containing protein [Paenibacillus gallinarum]MBD7968228.1 WG repeat-containing protein [Paenibacillus gallinarum]
MIRKLCLALLLLSFTNVTFSAPSSAATKIIKTKIEVSKTFLDHNIARPQSDGSFHNGLLLSEQSDGTLIYNNTKGNKAFHLPDNVKLMSDFYEQRALVQNKETKLYGYINTKGKLAIPCQFTEAGYFSEGVSHVTLANTNQQELIDRTGKIISHFLKKYDSDFYFSNGLAMVTDPKSNKNGFINTLGELTIPFDYTYARGFSEGFSLVQNNKGQYGYIDTSGKVIIPFQYKSGGSFSEGLASVQNNKGKWGFINKKGKVIIPFRYDNASDFSEGLAVVYNSSGKVGFINKKGKLVIGYQEYNNASNFKEGIALVGIGTNSDGKFGYIDRYGNLLTKLEYRAESSSFNGGYAIAVTSPSKSVILKKRIITK